MRLRRKSLFVAKDAFKLPARDSGVLNAMVRVHPIWIDINRKDQNRLIRRQAVLLRNLANQQTTLRFAFGSGDLNIQAPTTIAIDYDARDVLGIREDDEVNIEVLHASYFDVISFYWNHPDMGLQFSTRLGVIGFLLGLISLF